MPPLSQIFSEPKMPDNLRGLCRSVSGMPPLNITELSVDMILGGAREREEKMERTNIDGDTGLVLKYKGHDVYVVGISFDEATQTVTINQLQGVKSKKGYRVSTALDIQLFLINFCQVNFTQNGWKVTVTDNPTGIQKAESDTAFLKYLTLRASLESLTKK